MSGLGIAVRPIAVFPADFSGYVGPLTVSMATVANSTAVLSAETFWNDNLHTGDGGRTHEFQGVVGKVGFNNDNKIEDTGLHSGLKLVVNTPLKANFAYLKVVPPTKGIMTGGTLGPRLELYDPSTASGILGEVGGISWFNGLFSIFQGINVDTLQPNPLMQLYFINAPSTALIEWYSPSTQRLQIRNAGGAIVHVANNARYEWEGPNGGVYIAMVGYQLSTGKPISFTNTSQEDGARVPLIAVTCDTAADNFLIQSSNTAGNVFTSRAKFDGLGNAFVPQLTIGATLGAVPLAGAAAAVPVTNGDTKLLRSAASILKLDDGAGGFATIHAKLRTDTNAAAGTIVADHTLTFYDAAGVAYKVPCLTA